MAEDPISKRFTKKDDKHRLDQRSRKGRSIDDIEAEEKLLKETPKAETIKGTSQPGRNDPCPCGSGKKYKKCCGA